MIVLDSNLWVFGLLGRNDRAATILDDIQHGETPSVINASMLQEVLDAFERVSGTASPVKSSRCVPSTTSSASSTHEFHRLITIRWSPIFDWIRAARRFFMVLVERVDWVHSRRCLLFEGTVCYRDDARSAV